MIVTDIGCHPLFKKITLLMGSILLTHIVAAHKCYVCGPTNSDSSNDLIPSCDQFNSENPIYSRECSQNSKGCSIQINGSVSTRTCEELPIVDCRTANQIEYCYCNTDLCNSVHPTRQDEEDELEGSGSEREHITDVTRVLQIPSTPSSTVPSTVSSGTMYLARTLPIVWILVF